MLVFRKHSAATAARMSFDRSQSVVYGRVWPKLQSHEKVPIGGNHVDSENF
jgi:hypothetical protein